MTNTNDTQIRVNPNAVLFMRMGVLQNQQPVGMMRDAISAELPEEFTLGALMAMKGVTPQVKIWVALHCMPNDLCARFVCQLHTSEGEVMDEYTRAQQARINAWNQNIPGELERQISLLTALVEEGETRYTADALGREVKHFAHAVDVLRYCREYVLDSIASNRSYWRVMVSRDDGSTMAWTAKDSGHIDDSILFPERANTED